MRGLLVLIVTLLIVGYVSAINNASFTNDFKFGASTAAYQIEGAWNEDGKGQSIWDHYVHQHPSMIDDNQTGDETCNSYHNYKEDVKLLADMNFTHYRFSLSWTRILPNGFGNVVSEKGIQYYKNILSELDKYNITPLVTIYHWDLPQNLQDLGGWLNPMIVDYFVEYAKIVFREYGDLVQYWITINEPKQVCTGGYGKGSMAPGIALNGIGDYICAYNLIKAHASVYRLAQQMKLKGVITMALDTVWAEPASKDERDIEAAERKLQFEFGLYANPIFKGKWPDVVVSRVETRSIKENFNSSRLPVFTDDDLKLIQGGTADYVALNFYEANLVADAEEADFSSTSFPNDVRVNSTKDPSWPTGFGGNAITPWALRSLLGWINKKYDKPSIIITENGVADDGSSLYDINRVQFIADHLSSVLDAITQDDVKVMGYMHWSLMDNFEWRRGFTERFGLYSVNFSDPNKPRTPKTSVEFFKELATTRQIPDVNNYTTVSPEPTTNPSTTPTKKPGGSGTNIKMNVYLLLITTVILLKFTK